MKKLFPPSPSLPLLPPCGPPPRPSRVRTGHDLLHLPDHRQEGDFQVEGVSKIDVTFETREAVVTSMMPRPACRS